MNGYYDTGLLLKLYTAEPESPAVQAFVHSRAQSLQITGLQPRTAVTTAHPGIAQPILNPIFLCAFAPLRENIFTRRHPCQQTTLLPLH